MADTKEPTLEEVRESLRRTEQDHQRLTVIVENLSLFLYDTDQDRSDIVPALHNFQSLLRYCTQLRDKIRTVKEAMEKGEN